MADWSPTTEFPRDGDGHLDEDLLSAYVDGLIEDAATLAWVETHLASCGQCQQAVAELRTMVSLLGDLPQPASDRSFRLSPEMAPVRLLRPEPWYLRYQPQMRRLTAVAAVLLAFVLAVDVLVTQPQSPADSDVDMVSEIAADSASEEDEAEVEDSLSIREAAPADDPEMEAAEDAPESGEMADQPEAPVVDEAEDASAARAEDAPEVAEQSPPAAGIDQTGQVAADSPSVWRLAEVSLAVIVVWLLFLTVVLPKVYARHREG